ncbi:MAG: hypothetical protein C4K58_05920 [Flavobacteriaceae bacterium]|nr:MAG: hypothetical protein C4K58_05920 [Flavobacteriaceae bacterium]
MKKLLFALLFGVSFAHAQNTEPVAERGAYYLTSEIGGGNYGGFNIHLNYITPENVSIKFGASSLRAQQYKEVPDDFNYGGAVNVLFLGLGTLTEDTETYSISVGKVFPLNQRGTIRANLSAGLGYSIFTVAENFTKKDGLFYLDSNYTWEKKDYDMVSLIINPKLEFPFTRYVGLTLSPELTINEKRVYYGAGLGLMVGLLRDKNH